VIIQSDQKENKSERALQIIIGDVVAESYANKRSVHGRRQFVVSKATYNKSYLMNFRQLCILLLLSDNEENV
jgi:hypothetical protein